MEGRKLINKIKTMRRRSGGGGGVRGVRLKKENGRNRAGRDIHRERTHAVQLGRDT